MLNDLAKLTKLVNSKDAVRYQVSKVSVAVAYTIKSTAPPPPKKNPAFACVDMSES